MRELSLHILDVIQNSLTAGASLININLVESPITNLLKIEVQDNGRGIPPEQLAEVTDPFFTSRSTRKVGLGLALFKKAAEQSGGAFSIKSQLGIGTTIIATFQYDHIDRAPLGNMADTLLTLVISNPGVDFCYRHCYENNGFTFDTRELTKHISRSELEHPAIAMKLQEILTQGIQEIYIS